MASGYATDMLKQIIIGGFLGGMALFISGYITWAATDLHSGTIRSHEGITAVVENISEHLPETGVYYFPPANFDRSDSESMAAWMEEFETKPHGMIFYNTTLGNPMPPSRLLRGFLVDVLASMMATILLLMALPSLSGYWSRVLYVVSLGVFAILSVHLVENVFHDMPFSWTTGVSLDMAASWLFVGLVLGGVIKNK